MKVDKKTKFIQKLEKILIKGASNDEKNASFVINTGKYKYILRIRQIYNQYAGMYQYRIDLGGRKKGCVLLTFSCPFINNNNDIVMKMCKHGHLAFVTYFPSCSLNGDLLPGNGTKHMLKTALALSCDICEKLHNFKLEGFTLQDNSRKMCNEKESISLRHASLLLNSMTYYEKHFNAIIHNEQIYQSYRDLVNTMTKNRLPSFHEFSLLYSVPFEHNSILEPLYVESNTIIDFCSKIRDMYPDDFCRLCSGWVENFVNSHLKWINWTEWFIPSSNIKTIKVTDWEFKGDNDTIREVLIEDANFIQTGGFADIQSSKQYIANPNGKKHEVWGTLAQLDPINDGWIPC